ncbi:MAG: NTP transferase domain-containing protein [Ignavibacteriales bacterium]|nr:NTP transferase domain-containing protein [Ignavibacteriales bacterium]
MKRVKNLTAKLDLGIIAAGEGSRLKAEGIQLSKPMIPIYGKPLIQWIIESAFNSGIDKINCIINEHSNDLKLYLNEYNSTHKINLLVKNTVSSFHSLKEISQFLTPPFLIATADSIFRENEFKTFIEFGMNASNADVIVASTDFIDDEKPLYIKLDEDGGVVDFYDTADNFEFVTGGLYLFKKEIRDEISDAIVADTNQLRNFLRFLIKKEFRIQTFRFSKIIDVDHISDIKAAESYLSEIAG